MSDLIITVGSITTAVRTEKKLNSAGISKTAVIHTPPVINSGGCSYSIRTGYANLPIVKKLIYDKKIKVRRLYHELVVNGERVYNAVS